MESWKRNLYTLWAAEFLAALGMSFVIPFLPFFIRELGVKEIHEVERWAGLVFAGPFITAVFFTSFWGWLGDRYGRRLILIRALFCYAGVALLLAYVRTVQELFFLRVLQGALSGYIAATLAIVATITPRERMGYAMGFLQTSLTTGSIIGPFIGGILADAVGYRHIFFIMAGFGAAAGFLVIFLVDEPNRSRQQAKSPNLLSNYRFVFRSPVLLTLFLSSILIQTGIMSIQPILSLFVESLWTKTEYLATIAGGVFAITGLASLISSPYWGKKGDRIGFKKVLTLNLLGTAATFAPHAFVQQAYQLLILRFVHGLFVGGVLPALYTLTSLNIPEERRGGIIGIVRSGILIGNIFGPISGGFLAGTIGMRPLFIATAAILALVGLGARPFISESPSVDQERSFTAD
jgi:MFS transporter, DHA1 family, multidrug resistance protein